MQLPAGNQSGRCQGHGGDFVAMVFKACFREQISKTIFESYL
jgi:hypothetical protein